MVYEVDVRDTARCYGENSAQSCEIRSLSLHLLLTAVPIVALHLRLRLGDGVRWTLPPPRESPAVLLGPLGQFCDLCVCAYIV